METVTYYFYYLASLFTGFPLVIQIALVLIGIMGFLYALSWFSIGKGFYNKRKDTKRKRSLEEVMENIAFIFSSDDVLEKEQIREILSVQGQVKNWKKIYLSKFIVDEVDSREVNQANLATLVEMFGLPDYWENQLESGDEAKRWEAIRMLESISHFVPASIISKFATVKREGVSKYAKSVFTKFDSHDAFKFLEDDLGENLSELDKLRIHNSLKERSSDEVLPHLLRTTLNTKNDDYQIFLIKEIGLLGKKDGVEILLDLYKSTTNSEVKAEIVKTLSTLNINEALPVFMKDYNFLRPTVQDEIIDAAGRIGGRDSVEFLEKIYHQTPNKETLIKIIANIYKMEGIGTPVFNRLKAQNTNSFNNTVFAFVENQYS